MHTYICIIQHEFCYDKHREGVIPCTPLPWKGPAELDSTKMRHRTAPVAALWFTQCGVQMRSLCMGGRERVPTRKRADHGWGEKPGK